MGEFLLLRPVRLSREVRKASGLRHWDTRIEKERLQDIRNVLTFVNTTDEQLRKDKADIIAHAARKLGATYVPILLEEVVRLRQELAQSIRMTRRCFAMTRAEAKEKLLHE